MKNKKIIATVGLLVALCLIAFAFFTLHQKNELPPECTIEEIDKYEIKDVYYTFNKLDGMKKKYEIQIDYSMSFYLDGELIETSQKDYFHTSDDEFYNNVKKSPNQYGLYEVAVKLNNVSNKGIFDIDWRLDSEKHAIIATDYAVEGKSIDANKEDRFCFVVLIDNSDLTAEQVNKLLVSEGLNVFYRTEKSCNNIYIR